MGDGTENPVTGALSGFVSSSDWRDVPHPVRHEAKRALLNWLACAHGGSRSGVVDLALSAVEDFAGRGQATVINRGVRLDVANAAFVNAISSNVLDFDDTHLRTVIHPTVPVASAILALSEHVPVDGAGFMHAFILGVEAECRVGNAMSPEHYHAGWHITSTCGVIGAAAACAKLMKLGPAETAYALGMAASSSGGLAEMLGSMTRMINMGNAARNGFHAAWYAAKGITSSGRAFEAPKGFANAFSSRFDGNELVKPGNDSWELSFNAYKPYPCGIVVHPIIDGCISLKARHSVDAAGIREIRLKVHPLVVTVTGGSPEPDDELRAKVSAHHCAAVALIFGAAGVSEFGQNVVDDPMVVRTRRKVVLEPDEGMPRDAAEVLVVLENGDRFQERVRHARGSLELPLIDSEIEDKLRALVKWSGSGADTGALIRTVWNLDAENDAGIIARL